MVESNKELAFQPLQPSLLHNFSSRAGGDVGQGSFGVPVARRLVPTLPPRGPPTGALPRAADDLQRVSLRF